MPVGYARVSSAGRALEVQNDALSAPGCEKLYAEKESATCTDNRKALAEALDFVREGDTFLVTRIDRLARSVRDLEAIAANGEGEGCLPKGG